MRLARQNPPCHTTYTLVCHAAESTVAVPYTECPCIPPHRPNRAVPVHIHLTISSKELGRCAETCPPPRPSMCRLIQHSHLSQRGWSLETRTHGRQVREGDFSSRLKLDVSDTDMGFRANINLTRHFPLHASPAAPEPTYPCHFK